MADGAPLIVGQINTTRGKTRLRDSIFPPASTSRLGTFNVENDGSDAIVGTSAGAAGVLGVGITGVDSQGIFATTGVSGQGLGPGVGVIGACAQGFGLVATGQTGAYARGTGIGLLAYTDGGAGVVGVSDRASGVEARSTSGPALTASSERGPGAVVTSQNGPGLVASSPSGAAAYCSTGRGIAVRGSSGPQGWAGYLEGRVGVEGSVTVLGGPISEAVGPRQVGGIYRRLYCHLSPDSWIEDFGTAQLSGGTVTVQLNPDFAALIRPGSYDVFLTAYGPAALFVQSRATNSFQVNRISGVGGGSSASARFAYRIVGRPLAARPRLERVAMHEERIQIHPDLETIMRRASKALTSARQRAEIGRRAEKAIRSLKPVPRIRKRARKRNVAKR
jgi:hypothetical protein